MREFSSRGLISYHLNDDQQAVRKQKYFPYFLHFLIVAIKQFVPPRASHFKEDSDKLVSCFLKAAPRSLLLPVEIKTARNKHIQAAAAGLCRDSCRRAAALPAFCNQSRTTRCRSHIE